MPDMDQVYKQAGFGNEEDYNQFCYDIIQGTLKSNKAHPQGPGLWTKLYNDLRSDQYSYKSMDIGESSSDELDENTVVNIIRSRVNRYTALLVKPDMYIKAEPNMPQFVDHAKKAEYALNYYWRETEAQRQYKRIVRDSVAVGLGVGRIVWTLKLPETKNRKKFGKIVGPEYIKEDAPGLVRVDPRNFLWDPEASDLTLKSARWCAEVIYLPFYDVLTRDDFDKKVINEIGVTYKVQEYNRSYWATDDPNNKPRSLNPYTDNPSFLMGCRVEAYDFYDRKFGKHLIFLKGIPQPIWEDPEPWPDHLDGFPYALLPFQEQPDDRFPLGLGAMIMQSQNELNRNRAQMYEWRRRCANIQAAFNEKMLDTPEAEEDLVEGRTGQFIPVNGNPNEFWAALKFENNLLPLIQIDGIIQNDAFLEDGLSGMETGEGTEPRVPATGVAVQERFVNIFIKDKIANVDNFVNEVAKQWHQNMQIKLKKPIAMKILGPSGVDFMTETGPDGSPVPIMVSAADVQADLSVKVVASELPNLDPVTELRALQELYNSEVANVMVLSQIQPEAMPDFLEFKRVILEKLGMQQRNRIYPGIARTPVTPSGPDQAAGAAGQEPASAIPESGEQAMLGAAVSPVSEAQGPAGGMSGGAQY